MAQIASDLENNLKFIKSFTTCVDGCVVMFITAGCLLFLLKLKWPKNKSVYDEVTHVGNKVRLFNGEFFHIIIFLSFLSGFPYKSLYFCRPRLH